VAASVGALVILGFCAGDLRQARKNGYVSFRVRQYQYKEAECLRLAEQAREPSVKVALTEIAAQWRELASHVEGLDRERASLQAK
jgi:hypothetical protein